MGDTTMQWDRKGGAVHQDVQKMCCKGAGGGSYYNNGEIEISVEKGE